MAGKSKYLTLQSEKSSASYTITDEKNVIINIVRTCPKNGIGMFTEMMLQWNLPGRRKRGRLQKSWIVGNNSKIRKRDLEENQ